MSRRTIFWIVAGLAAALLVAVLGTILFAFLNEETLVEDTEEGIAPYFAIFGLVFGDAIVPIIPGETTLNTASVLASQGKLELEWVIVAGALGAIVGDSTLYWIARTGPRRLKARLEATGQSDERVAKGLALLGRSGPLLIACGRFVPGVRFAVNVSMGMLEYPYRRFLLFSSIGGIAWATYTCVLSYWVSTAIADFPLASIVISGFVTTILIAAVYWIDRRRRPDDETPTTPAAEPTP